MDEVDYNNAAPWPAGANGTGYSLQRISPWRYGNDPINWQASTVVGGTPGISTVPQLSVGFGSTAYTVANNAGSAQIDVDLTAPAAQDVTVTYATADNTAIAGTDYTATSNSLTIPRRHAFANVCRAGHRQCGSGAVEDPAADALQSHQRAAAGHSVRIADHHQSESAAYDRVAKPVRSTFRRHGDHYGHAQRHLRQHDYRELCGERRKRHASMSITRRRKAS